MTSGTREVQVGDEVEVTGNPCGLSKPGRDQPLGYVGKVISVHVGDALVGNFWYKLSDVRVVPTPTPPPLQPGDEVWVRAVVHDTDGTYGEFADAYVNVRIAGLINSVPLSSIRRVEGEVKP